MDAKTIFGICVAVIILAMGGCFGNASHGQGQQSMQSSACYADAQQQLSPQWASASTLDRAAAAFSVISVCEGGN